METTAYAGCSSTLTRGILASAPVATGYIALYAWLVLSTSENPIEKPSPYNFEAHAATWHDTALLDDCQGRRL